MHLKTIEIHGFKSFADKILLQFEQGITAVVGPNGSGKSNIADAVRWVLGEQSVKALRGSKMEDVIFAGTEHRKPLSFAEVSLVLDNSDKALPVEYSEVNISRRIFRSGESEFYINKSLCRLKDIHELFMDTGIGKDGYSIIGQGRIDEMLSSKSEDRRNIFEEAAGIMKYKSRKVEAERKLESTKQNILRINDIINELNLQLDPLKEQSDKAKEYLKLAQELKILDINLFIDNYAKLNEKFEASKIQYSEVENTLKEYNEKIINLDQDNLKFSEQNKEFENEILYLNQQIFEAEKQSEKISYDISLANEKILNSEQNKERILKENISYNEKVSALDSDLEDKNKKAEEIYETIEQINSLLIKKEKEVEDVNKLLEENLNQIEDLKSEIIEKYNQISVKKGSINNINVLLDNIINRNNQIQSEIKDLEDEKQLNMIELKGFGESIDQIKKWLKDSTQSISQLNQNKLLLEEKLDQSSKDINKIKETVNSKISRHSFLCDMDKEYEGFNKSVKSILFECQRSKSLGKGVHGALVQLISVPKTYEVAIETALGGALQNIVVDDEETAQKTINYLKINNLGRATFLPLTSVKGRDFEKIGSELAKLEGYVGVAAKLLQCDDKYINIVNNLLGKVLVIDNISNAIVVAKKYKYQFKIVTLDGEVLNVGGSIAGGSVNKTTSLLGRSREIQELSNQISELNKKLEELIKANVKLQESYQETVFDIEKENNFIRENELILVSKEAQAKQFKDNIDRTSERLKVLNIETGQLSEQKNQAHQDMNSLNIEINELLFAVEEMSKKTTIDQDKYKKDIELRDNLIEFLTAEKIKLSGVNQELVSVKENVDRVKNEIEEINKQISENNKLVKSLDVLIVEARELIESKNKELDSQKILKDELQLKLNKKTLKKVELENNIGDLQKWYKEYNSAISIVSEEKSKIQIKVTKYEMELESLQNRIWDDYEMTYGMCLEYKQDISRFGNPNKAINQIKAQINTLGNINVSAIEEYIKVKERFEFLTKQRDDLQEAEKSLRKVISDMIHIMKKQFVEQFEIINSNFNDVFKELFGGGRAYLRLIDDENVLECGIEIEAQPPGKKLQNLTLLSGGERALTAIAILFAMLKVRPTPFCVLDEIESALDDVNVVRFAQYIKKFAYKTQFLVITHRKGTMETASSIYGITMQEHGISKLVSIKLSDQAS